MSTQLGLSQLSEEQTRAYSRLDEFMNDPKKQVFRLFGPAGCGKTSIARVLTSRLNCIYAAVTGRASARMAEQGCPNAGTVCSHFYDFDMHDREAGKLIFSFAPSEEVMNADLLVFDECSMLNDNQAADVVSLEKKILVLGDPFQLPPVEGLGHFTIGHDPDVLLTEVHRQALENPILRWATAIRETKSLVSAKEFCDQKHLALWPDPPLPVLGSLDQVLCGTHRTRLDINRKIRENKGFKLNLHPGDKLVCTRNSRQNQALMNGTLWTVLGVKARQYDIEAELKNDEGTVVRTLIHPKHLEESAGPFDLGWKFQPFQYGYAITVHKAQGSQWDTVALYNESRCFREHAARHLYTGATRAAKQMMVC